MRGMCDLRLFVIDKCKGTRETDLTRSGGKVRSFYQSIEGFEVRNVVEEVLREGSVGS